MRSIKNKDLRKSNIAVINNINNDYIIIINISGLRYETMASTLERYPNTLLGNQQRRAELVNKNSNEIFLDRHRPSFDAILNYYQSYGRLLKPPNVPLDIFVDELKFFDLGEDLINLMKIDDGYMFEDDEDSSLVASKGIHKSQLQKKMWKFFEFPDSSIWARYMALLSMIMILVSVVTFCLETMPQFKTDDLKITKLNNQTLTEVNGTDADSLETSKRKGGPWFIVESFCVTFFTLEFVLRLIAAPNRLRFLRSIINLVDLLAILPFYIAIFFDNSTEESIASVGFLRAIRLVRVFRILKLGRHSTGLKILGLTLRHSFHELCLLSLFLLMGVVIFSSAVYYAEMTIEDSNFKSIPDAFWWAIITMTTVGYGDMRPVTFWGKMVGGMCAISGVLTVALPVPVIVSNFGYFYQKYQLTKTGRSKKTNITWFKIFFPCFSCSDENTIVNIHHNQSGKRSESKKLADSTSSTRKLSRMVTIIGSTPEIIKTSPSF